MIEMNPTWELVLWATGLAIGFILGWLTNLYFYKKQSEENKANAETLKQLEQYIDGQIRVGNDKRGKIVKRPDGTIGIDWQVNISETASESVKAELKT
jgi:hypothetical protein